VADLATLVARFGAALHAAGLPVGADRCERFARAILLVRPRSTRQLYWCARTTLVFDPAQFEVFDAVFAAVFGGIVDPADARGDPRSPALVSASTVDRREPGGRTVTVRTLPSAEERLASRDFGDLSPAELLLLADLMRRLRIATPLRRSRRRRRVSHGDRVDLRTTLRQARRTGGDALRLARHEPRQRHRRLVALCDISGSMEPYARAMLQLLYCATGGTGAEVFTFATQLTRLTRVLARTRIGPALQHAGRSAPDWSGGTRIGAALKEFNDRYGRRGLARGAIVLIISDGWETGDAKQLAREMARLSLVAYRIVWVNPRTQSPRYRPLVGGMAAAWPYCDVVVSAHRLDALDELLAALADPVRAGDRRLSGSRTRHLNQPSR
jgi:uncharacterized protein with von Willebrand factor type A (vWA) domain